jgi:hypothetical protein
MDRRFIWIGLGALLTGCASQTLSSGSSLATAGQAAASQMSGSVTLSSNSLQQVRTALAFEDGYNGQFGASQGLQSQIAIYQRNLRVYSKMLTSLQSAYAALGSLSGYNAAGNFGTAINSLGGDINAFAKITGSKTAPLSSSAINAVGAIGGQALAFHQAQRVKAGSAKIAVQLSQIIAILSEPHVRNQVVPAQELIQGDINQAATTLFNAHLYSYTPLVDQLGAPLGLKTLPNADATVDKDPRVSAGLRNVEQAQSAAQVAAIGQLYDTNLGALRALLPLHKQLEDGRPLNTAAIAAIISQIETIASEIKQNPPPAPAQKES